MFIGHFGLGFAAKKITPKPSLGTLFFAAQFIDLIWPILLILGLERVEIDPGNTIITPLNFIHYPISHSLFGVIIWALIFGGFYFLIKRNFKNAVWLSVLVLSHWFLDLLTHRPDLQILPWNEFMVGFGLWNSLIGTIALEGLIFVGGVYLYLKCTKARNVKGTWGLWTFILFLIIIYFSNLFGPLPPSAEPIAYLAFAQWLLIAWGYWIDRNREYRMK